MDNLAHTLTGVALARAGLKNRTALGTATLVIAANLPDVDVAVLLFGNGLAHRRGWTHGVLALVFLPILLSALMLAWDRWVRRRRGRVPTGEVRPWQLLLLAFVGVLSHSFLDWLNTYGIRWLMPFDQAWFYGDALFIVDPWLWLVLLLGILLGRGRRRERAARVSISVAGLYIATMLGSAIAGRRMVDEAMREAGAIPDAVMVGPVPLNPNRREVVVRQAGLYYRGTLEWLPSPRLRLAPDLIRANLSHPASLLATQDPDAGGFLRWARFPYFVVSEAGNGFSVRLDDLRYSDGMSPSWASVDVEIPFPSIGAPPVATRETGSPRDP